MANEETLRPIRVQNGEIVYSGELQEQSDSITVQHAQQLQAARLMAQAAARVADQPPAKKEE